MQSMRQFSNEIKQLNNELQELNEQRIEDKHAEEIKKLKKHYEGLLDKKNAEIHILKQ